MTTNDKYLLFRRIEPKLRRRALVLAGGDNYSAQEILAAAADLFVFRFKDTGAGEGGALNLAKLWLLDAARSLRLCERQVVANDAGRTDWGGPAISPLPPLAAPPLPAAWQIWERLPAAEQVGVVAEVIRQCLAGHDLADAGAAVGWSAVQTTRELARLGERITGNRPARYTSRRPVRLSVPAAA